MSRGATALCAGIAPLLLLLAAPAVGQDRLSLERMKEAICEKADADAESFRPKICDPRCDCLDGVDLSAADICVETAPGVFAVEQVVPARDAVCKGGCFYTLPDPPYDVVGTGEFCATNADCTVGACFFADPNLGTPFDTCFDDELHSCSKDSQCASGFSCSGGLCKMAYSLSCGSEVPSTPIVCASLPELTFSLAGLSGVGPADSAAVVTCEGTSINSNDALECLAQIETTLGQTCTAYTP